MQLQYAKHADADHPIAVVIADRWSPRAFADRAVADSHQAVALLLVQGFIFRARFGSAAPFVQERE
jgi:hypothetical protein